MSWYLGYKRPYQGGQDPEAVSLGDLYCMQTFDKNVISHTTAEEVYVIL